MDNFPIKTYVEPITQKDETGETSEKKTAATKNLYSGPGAKVKAKGKEKLIISWPKVKKAAGYEVYLSRSDKATMKRVKTIKGNKIFKWTKAGLKKGKSYKVCVKAYRMEKGRKIYVMKSPVMYSYTGGSKRYTNAQSVKVEKSKVALKAGKTSRIKAKVRKQKKGKIMSSKRVAKLRYLSNNQDIAKVSKSGKITAVKKGKCKVYVYAHNGVYTTVAVTVR